MENKQNINNKNLKVLCTQEDVPQGAEQLESIIAENINQKLSSEHNSQEHYAVSINFNKDLESAKNSLNKYDLILCGHSKCSEDLHEDSEKNAAFIGSLIEKNVPFVYFDDGNHFRVDLEHMLPFMGICPYENLARLWNKSDNSNHSKLTNLGQFYLGPNKVSSYAEAITNLLVYYQNQLNSEKSTEKKHNGKQKQ